MVYDDKVLQFKIIETDYESFLIKCAQNSSHGCYLLMNTANPDDTKVQELCFKYQISGVKVN